MPGGLIFAGFVPFAPQNPYPIIAYSVANYTDPFYWLLSKCNFHFLSMQLVKPFN